MRLRIAISHEAAAKRSSWRDTLALKWENTIRPLAVQVSAGAACSVALVGSIMVARSSPSTTVRQHTPGQRIDKAGTLSPPRGVFDQRCRSKALKVWFTSAI